MEGMEGQCGSAREAVLGLCGVARDSILSLVVAPVKYRVLHSRARSLDRLPVVRRPFGFDHPRVILSVRFDHRRARSSGRCGLVWRRV